MTELMKEVSDKKVYGIDLGSTYSAIAVVDETGDAVVIPNTEGERITASAVYFEPAEEFGRPNIIVGQTAKEAGTTDPDHFVDFVKYHQVDYEWKQEICGIEWTPEEILAQVLKKLVKGVEEIGNKVEDVVIACPAYFNDVQRHSTELAGMMAGVNVLAVINEPMAAAFHYGLHCAEDHRTTIVYDLGGATFDVTVLKVSENGTEIICCDGDHNLGGRNWDAKIVQYLAGKFAEEHGYAAEDLLEDPETAMELRIGSEIVKQTLSSRPKARRKVCYGNESSRIEIDRETFDALTRPLLDETEQLTEKMMSLAAEKGITKFDEFLLVGGSTRMPQVMEMVKRRFGSRIANEPRMHDVDEAIAKGAAIYGALFKENPPPPYPPPPPPPPPSPPPPPAKALRGKFDLRIEGGGKILAMYSDLLAGGDKLPIAEKSVSLCGPLTLAEGGLSASLVFWFDHAGPVEIARMAIGVPQPTIKTDFSIGVGVGISESADLTLRVVDNNSSSVLKTVLPLEDERYFTDENSRYSPFDLVIE